jgi:hypothetical protein
MGPEKVIFLWTGRSTEVAGKSSKAALGGLRCNNGLLAPQEPFTHGCDAAQGYLA